MRRCLSENPRVDERGARASVFQYTSKENCSERAEALLARAQCLLGAPPPGAELRDQQAESDEYREGQRMVRRNFERLHRRDEPVPHPGYANCGSQQAGPASAVPCAEEHGHERKLVDGGAFPERKDAAQEERQPGQPERNAIAHEQIPCRCGSACCSKRLPSMAPLTAPLTIKVATGAGGVVTERSAIRSDCCRP